MNDFDTSVFWPAFKDAGMLKRVSVKPRAGGATLFGDVLLRMPDRPAGTNAQSREYEIEYQVADFPKLAEGDVLQVLDSDDAPVAGMKFKVRRAAYVSDRPLDGDDGTYQQAQLTKQ